jgi:hypothetical protein
MAFVRSPIVRLRDGRLICFGLVAANLVFASPSHLHAEGAFDYPPSKTVGVVDDYHGTKVADPYRWLEDLESTDTKSWTEAQNSVTHRYLESLPMRRAFHERIAELWNYPKTSVPWREGGRLWYRRNSGLQRQAVVYFRESADAGPVIAFDPNLLSPDGSISLAQFSPSPDGRFLAYSRGDIIGHGNRLPQLRGDRKRRNLRFDCAVDFSLDKERGQPVVRPHDGGVHLTSTVMRLLMSISIMSALSLKQPPGLL